MAHDTVEDAPSEPVVIHAELEEMAQKTPALRDTKSERVVDAGIVGPRPLGDQRVRRAVAVGGLLGTVVLASDTGLRQVAPAALASR